MMSRQECGRRGAIQLGINSRKRYDANPKLCNHCSAAIPYEKRHTNNFCDHSCAAKHTNKSVKLRGIECHNCNTSFKPVGRATKYCSIHCATAFRSKEVDLEIEQGLRKLPGALKRYLITNRGYKCEDCKNATWNDRPIPLELDHIDGDHTNNFPINLRLLCPNCHALTDTYKNKNKGKGREHRRKRYNEIYGATGGI